jgi:glutamate dehydrogenase
MAKPSLDQKSQRIDKVVVHMKERLSGDEAGPLERFIRLYYGRVTAENVAEASLENLYGAALSLWKFCETRSPGQAKIRAFNPRLGEQGWTCDHTVVEVVSGDMPFIVDSLSSCLNRRGHKVFLNVHPVARLRRTAKGRLKELLAPTSRAKGGSNESLIHIEIDTQTTAKVLRGIEQALQDVLADVRAAVEDWPAMLAKLDGTIKEIKKNPPPLDKDEVSESLALLQWLADDHFTLLGFRQYEHKGSRGKAVHRAIEGSGLGILRNPDTHVLAGAKGLGEMSAEVRHFLDLPQLMMVIKANVRSTVHRPVHMDYIGVKRLDKKGRLIGELRFVGLFTSAAYNQSPLSIPLLRRKIKRAVQLAGMQSGGHDGKALINVLETFPRDELFQVDEDYLAETAQGIVELQDRPRIRCFYRLDPYGRFASCLIFVPRELHSTELRTRFGEALATAFAGEVSTFYTHIVDSPLARLHFIIRTRPTRRRQPDRHDLERALVKAARSWDDDLEVEILERWGEEHGNRLARRYGRAFPAGYREAISAPEAVFDIEKMEALSPQRDMQIDIYRPPQAEPSEVRFKIFHLAQPLPLSDCMPILEHMGFRVMEERPYCIRAAGRKAVWQHDFGLLIRGGHDFDLDATKENFQEAFIRIWSGEVEDDGFNRLIVLAGLDWREIVVLRAYCKYLRQAAIAFSQAYMEDTLAANPGIALLLIKLFRQRFDPQLSDERDGRCAALVAKIQAALDEVANLDEDRILRRFLNLVRSTLRTNFFQLAEDGGAKPYLAFKLDSQRLAELPLPRPLVETWVYAPRAEAIHLRGGKVARGGIRWSDRREDFRTEVLGLMKAQMVKNAVIVPVGAKGGFVTKRLPSEGGREAIQAEVIACYKTLMFGLLDLADNLAGGAVVPPRDVVRYDDDDPYLVVAADKGTATFSDIANGVAIDYGFWLGDAFASGGSAGYDHKGMGITARGAWESVKRHFREMGIDCQSQDFTTVGVGDMSGDVFGNGMLLSKHIRLVGAFNHLHIFVDPKPNAGKSFTERQRLFALPRSGWNDYDKKLISRGGGIFERSAKSVKLTPEIKALVKSDADDVTPNELIRLLLTAPVDLLWSAGIGTYVKASNERHADTGDRGNDAVRVDAAELSCRVVGEGGNLGLTQRARIEFARGGGRVNSDAIDNSGGVDCSDHEVNIKVLVDAVVADGGMAAKQRNRLLADMTDEVGELVLKGNYLQTQAISGMAAVGSNALDSQVRFMRGLERAGRLDRELEFLPDEETIDALTQAGESLTRPELSVLLSYCKMTLYEDILGSELCDDEYLVSDLERYFPATLRGRLAGAIPSHSLRREIIATLVANSLVNRTGATLVADLGEDTGLGPADIARAFVVARDAFNFRELWAAIEGLDNQVPAEVQMGMILAVSDLMGQATQWFLQQLPQPIEIAATVAAYEPGIAAFAGDVGAMLAGLESRTMRDKTKALTRRGVPRDIALRVAALDGMRSACHVVYAALASKRPVDEVGRIYFSVGAELGLDWLRSAAEGVAPDGHWDRLAVGAIVDDLYAQQRALATRVIRDSNGKRDKAAVKSWVLANQTAVDRSASLIEEFRSSGSIDIARLALANRQVRSMLTT